MASLVLGAAGAAVGSFIGGPLGASIGWSLGSALGGALFPGKGQNGPRLTDLKIHSSSYGQMIPILYGTSRLAGTVIWQTDLQEHEETSGGKGGGPEVTTFTYSASFAVMVTEGPIGGVLRIWADSRLVWDPSSMDPDDFPFTLYTGTETQLPDPTIEGVEGVGNVPAHRGTAYFVFDTFFLTDYGNRIPSLTFEVYGVGGPIPWRVSTITDTPVSFWPTGGVYGTCARAGAGGYGPTSAMLDDEGRLLLGYVDGTDSLVLVPAPAVNYTIKAFDLQGTYIEDVFNDTITQPPGNTNSLISVIPCVNNPFIQVVHQGNPGTGLHPSTSGSTPAWYVNGVFHEFITDPYGDSDSYGPVGEAYQKTVWSDVAEAVYGTGQPWGNPPGVAFVAKWEAPGGVPASIPSASYTFPPLPGGGFSVNVDDAGGVWTLTVQPTNPDDPQLIYFDQDLNFIHGWKHSELPGAGDVAAELDTGGYYFTVWNGIIFYASNGLPCRAYYIDFNTWTFTLTDPGTVNLQPGSFGSSNMISLGNGLAVGYDGVFSLVAQPQAVTLASIVRDLSLRAGLTDNQIDVSQLGDLVDGYVVTNQSDVRSLIEPLQIAWPFDAVEHDVVIKFARRGYDPTITEIPLADLGAYAYPGEPPAAMVTTRDQEVDLPRIVDVTFINKDTDYQNGEQRGQRLITTSQLTTSVQLAIVMDNDKGKEIADGRLYEAWIERERFKLQLSRKWMLLEPSDLIIADNRTMRITQATEGADGVMRFDASATDLQLYMQASPAPAGVGMPGSGGTPPTTPPVLQATDLILLDLPLIRDFDNPVGFYAAMAGATQPSWPGAKLYKSIDGGLSFNPEISNTTHDTFGDCSTTLGDFGGGNVFDESNSLTVVLSLGSGTLASQSRLAVLNGANMAAVGVVGTTGVRDIEIIQFRDAELIGTRTYKLTGLLRGRRGTEWMIGSHVAGEKFVLLPTKTNVVGLPEEIYLERKYRAVTSGRPLSSADIISFTNYGAAPRPYAPCNLGGGFEVNGDITLTWIRRTRIGGVWAPFVDVPLGEATEAYLVRIYSDNTYTTVLRYIGLIPTTSYTYTVADQTTDFGSPPSTLYWTVSQLGTYVYGTEAKGVI